MNAHMHGPSRTSAAPRMGWALVLSTFLLGCEAAPTSSVLHEQAAETTIILPGKAVFAPGSTLITESGHALLARSLAPLPPDAALSIAVYSEGKKAPMHSRPENRLQLSTQRADKLATTLKSEGKTVTSATGKGDSMPGDQPPDRRIEIVATRSRIPKLGGSIPSTQALIRADQELVRVDQRLCGVELFLVHSAQALGAVEKLLRLGAQDLVRADQALVHVDQALCAGEFCLWS